MFDFIADGLTILISILFPIYASYKALSTSDPAVLHPWLIYWVCLAILTASTSLLYPIISYLPFFSWIRFGLHLYLLLPGEQQGAAYIYRNHVDPWFKAHDKDIEHLISTGHDRIKAAGLEYFKRAIAFVKAQLLGMQDSSSSSASSARPTTSTRSEPPQEQQGQAQNYAQSLIARFALPSARPATTTTSSSTNTSAAVEGAGFTAEGGLPNSAAMYSLLSSALQAAAATGMISSSNSSAHAPSQSAPAARTPAVGDPADRAKYAEGLRALLKAFDKQPAHGHDGADDPTTSPGRAPARVSSPPVGFEAIEHEDAQGSELGEKEKPAVLKRRSTSGSGWGGWWGGKKEVEQKKDVLSEKIVVEGGNDAGEVKSVS